MILMIFKRFSLIPRAIKILNGPYTFDRFSDNNVKVEKFNSTYSCPNTRGGGAITGDLTNENSWICPTVALDWRRFSGI